MSTEPTNKTRWHRLLDILLPIAIALIFLVFTFSYFPFREKLQHDSDEGLNLMRSMLVALGHPLYAEVSSDQPPLFTHLLALLFRIVGFEVNPARVLVLLFAALLVWSGAQILQLTWGKLAAIFFLPLAIMVPQFLRLSTSVMIGVPSIALAAVAMVFVILWHLKKDSIWLFLSGFALALSVLIKLFTGFFAPIFLIGITASAYFERREAGFSWRIFRPALIWGVSFASLGILLGLALVGPQNLLSITAPHISAPSTEGLGGANYTLINHIRAAFPLLALGALGALVSVYRRNWLALYPLAWAAVAFVLFSFYSPVFYHHQLLITVPMTIMAAAAVGDGVLSLLRLKNGRDILRFQTLLGAGALIGFVLVSINYAPTLDRELMNSPRLTDFSLRATAGKLRVIDAMSAYSDQTNWIVTDMPMYAFRVGRPVPPALATFSSKRLATGSLTEEDILSTMREYKPEQVLMARFVIPSLEKYLEGNYTLIFDAEFFRLFVRNDLAPVTK